MHHFRFDKKLPDRQPVVSGKFYTSDGDELKKELNSLFSQAERYIKIHDTDTEKIRAIVSPHAGYIFSGLVSATAYIHLRKRKNIKRVFIIGTSHYARFEGVSVYYEGHYLTPLGKLEIDTEIAKSLIHAEEIIGYYPEAHDREHSIEVQLPFLQYILDCEYKIIPIIIGAQTKETPAKLAEVLKKYFNSENLFIISTDLSHYPAFNDAVKIDQSTIQSICANDPHIFKRYISDTENKRIHGLVTSICGWSSMLTLLNITSGRNDINYEPVLYQNSGEIALYGDKSRVVGYQSILILSNINNDETFSLSSIEKTLLLQHARESINRNINEESNNHDDENSLPRALLNNYGAFVSVYVDKNLRGCIGKITADESIYKTVGKMAIASSSYDSRFKPIQKSEVDKMKIEISILSPLQEINSIEEIIPEKHGILIRKGYRSGTFLPQVARKTGWGTEKLLSECADKKAGIGPDGWKDADIFIYEALVFSE